MKPEKIHSMDVKALYKAFTAVREPSKQYKHLKKLYKWGNRKLFDAVAQRMEETSKNSPDTVQVWDNGRVTVSNVHRYCDELCAYIRGNALLYDVMREYRYEPTDYSKTAKPIPPKLTTYFRLCEEAAKRHEAMRVATVFDGRYDAWQEVYYHKLEQVYQAGQSVRGSEAYYDLMLWRDGILDLHNVGSDEHRVADAVLDAARQMIVELNKNSYEVQSRCCV